jgi:hypothetical protein
MARAGRAIQRGDCLRKYPNLGANDPDPCMINNWPMMILFGALQARPRPPWACSRPQRRPPARPPAASVR